MRYKNEVDTGGMPQNLKGGPASIPVPKKPPLPPGAVPPLPVPNKPPLPAGPAPGGQADASGQAAVSNGGEAAAADTSDQTVSPLPPPDHPPAGVVRPAPGVPPGVLPPPRGPPPTWAAPPHGRLPPPRGPPPGFAQRPLPPPTGAPPGAVPLMPPPQGPPPGMMMPPPSGPPPAAATAAGQLQAKKEVKTTIKGASTVTYRPAAQDDKAIISMIPASVRVKRESEDKPKMRAAKRPAIAAGYGLAPKLNSPAMPKKALPSAEGSSEMDIKYAEFMQNMKDLGALEADNV